MTRGRKAQPEEIKEMRGNPGKRRLLALEAARKGQTAATAAAADVIATPEWLNNAREQAIFRLVVDEYQQRRIARATDIHAYARWAHYMRRWIDAKEQLGENSSFYQVESNHGKRLALHPLLVVMFRCEAEITKQEDRLGLNPAARQNIIRGMSSLGTADMFGKVPTPPPDDDDDIAEATAIESPLGFLQGIGKPN